MYYKLMLYKLILEKDDIYADIKIFVNRNLVQC